MRGQSRVRQRSMAAALRSRARWMRVRFHSGALKVDSMLPATATGYLSPVLPKGQGYEVRTEGLDRDFRVV